MKKNAKSTDSPADLVKTDEVISANNIIITLFEAPYLKYKKSIIAICTEKTETEFNRPGGLLINLFFGLKLNPKHATPRQQTVCPILTSIDTQPQQTS